MVETHPDPSMSAVKPSQTLHPGVGRTPRIWSRLYAGSSWLTITGVLMLLDILISLSGLALDPTMITGAPAWMKPLKFAISTALFCFTVAWMIGEQSRFRSLAKWLGRLMAAALVLEIVLIDMQAGRHTTSHFNFTTSFDASVFATMGMGIAALYTATAALFLLACLNRYSDRALGWAIRLGLLFSLAGMGTGVLMTLPTPAQLAAEHAKGGRMPHIGAHTVGAADGGPGMPLTGWSADHGDLRIAHFLGLHAMQILLLGWWLSSRSPRFHKSQQTGQVRLVIALAASTLLAFAIVLAQALRGEPLLHPDLNIVLGWAAWLAITTITIALSIAVTNIREPVLSEGNQ